MITFSEAQGSYNHHHPQSRFAAFRSIADIASCLQVFAVSPCLALLQAVILMLSQTDPEASSNELPELQTRGGSLWQELTGTQVHCMTKKRCTQPRRPQLQMIGLAFVKTRTGLGANNARSFSWSTSVKRTPAAANESKLRQCVGLQYELLLVAWSAGPRDYGHHTGY